MNLFINTNYKLPKNILNSILNITSVDIIITQLNADNINEILGIINNDENELINKIKTFFNNSNLNISSNEKLILKKLCLLYFKGGIFINSNISISNFDLLKKLYLGNDVCMIKSTINESNIFDGLICCKKKNTVLLNIIEKAIDISNIQNIYSLLYNNNNVILLNKELKLDKSNIYYNDEIIAEHYLNNYMLLENIKINKNMPKPLSDIKIGITINVPENLKSFYSNGIRQNCLYLYELLKNMNYNVKMIIDNITHISTLTSIDFYNFEYILQNDVFMCDFDLIFSMGFSFPNSILNCLKNTDVKLISYVCGNQYLIDSELILYSQHTKKCVPQFNEFSYDQVWIIPQMYKQNKCYIEILSKKKCIKVPFIWSTMSIKITSKILNLDNDNSLLYSKKKSKIGIFEPNLSVMKWALPCLLIAEKSHNLYKNVEHVYVTNLNRENSDINNFNIKEFNKACQNLELFKEKKISAESRYNTLEFMSKYCDIAISHQWENPLNYLYLDLAWMGWPILHNAYLCKDVGYYYEEFNYTEASEILNDIILNHHTNVNEYIKKNREVIDEYLPTNKNLQNNYKKLIEDLFIK